MKLEIDLQDEISTWVRYELEHNADFLRKATKSVGWFVQRDIKQQGLKIGGYIASQYKKRTPYKEVRRKLSPTAPPKNWYGRMKNAIGYEYDGGGVDIGWTSNTSAYYGKVQEFGVTRRVTKSTYALFRKAGVKLGNKKQIIVPARPIFEPAMPVVTAKIPDFVESKIEKYIEKGTNFGKRARRKYKVVNL